MRIHGAFAAKRIPLPSRVQVQSERERLRRLEQRLGKLLRCLAACIALWLLLAVIAAVCFPVVRVADAALAPLLRSGDLVLLLRIDNAAAGQLCAYTAGETVFLRYCGADESTRTAQLMGRALLCLHEDMSLQFFS